MAGRWIEIELKKVRYTIRVREWKEFRGRGRFGGVNRSFKRNPFGIKFNLISNRTLYMLRGEIMWM